MKCKLCSRFFAILIIFLIPVAIHAQGGGPYWSSDGNSYYRNESGDIVKYTLPANSKTVLVKKDDLKPKGAEKPLTIRSFRFSADNNKLLIYTNSKKVWRLDTRGDYWIYDMNSKQLKQLGISRPASSLMFAKFSPDGKKAAYV